MHSSFSILQGKKILLGICGGIAAYKSAYLVRLLRQSGAHVKVLMTPNAENFVGKLTFSTLSMNPVFTDFYQKENGVWNNHVELALWADLFVVAPATANTISKMNLGVCDNLLLVTYFSRQCDAMIFPAMDEDMFNVVSIQQNMESLKAKNVMTYLPAFGPLASGLVAMGRMQEPEIIQTEIASYFIQQIDSTLKNKKILITAGPTFQKIDPIRYIGNFSSGKMGFAIAEACLQMGAIVTLIHGPVHETIQPNKNLTRISVLSAHEMFNACYQVFPDIDIFIAAAAVADYTPINPSNHKIKKEELLEEVLQINLERTKDILGELSNMKSPHQIIIGFALETKNAIEYGRKKLIQKNLDAIIINSLEDEGAGFQSDTNKISILDKHNNLTKFELKSKKEIAQDIVRFIQTLYV